MVAPGKFENKNKDSEIHLFRIQAISLKNAQTVLIVNNNYVLWDKLIFVTQWRFPLTQFFFSRHCNIIMNITPSITNKYVHLLPSPQIHPTACLNPLEQMDLPCYQTNINFVNYIYISNNICMYISYTKLLVHFYSVLGVSNKSIEEPGNL